MEQEDNELIIKKLTLRIRIFYGLLAGCCLMIIESIVVALYLGMYSLFATGIGAFVISIPLLVFLRKSNKERAQREQNVYVKPEKL